MCPLSGSISVWRESQTCHLDLDCIFERLLLNLELWPKPGEEDNHGLRVHREGLLRDHLRGALRHCHIHQELIAVVLIDTNLTV